MALQEKYKELIDTAKNSGVRNLQVSEQNNVLHITGEAPNGQVKDTLWNMYNKIDPDYRAGDLVLDVNTSTAAGNRNIKSQHKKRTGNGSGHYWQSRA
jgi:hypothetical protein